MNKSFKQPWLLGASAAVLLTLAGPVAVSAQARGEQSFDIPAQDLAERPARFRPASGKQLAFDESLTRGKRAPQLKGAFTADEGLARLLAGSNLVVQPTASGVYAIRERPLLVSASAAGQAAAPATAVEQSRPEEPAQVEEVIVVGTPGGAGIDKLSASFAVTTVNAQDILKASPKSSAEAPRPLVPGVWVETSGGVAGANVFVRGFSRDGRRRVPDHPAAGLADLSALDPVVPGELVDLPRRRDDLADGSPARRSQPDLLERPAGADDQLHAQGGRRGDQGSGQGHDLRLRPAPRRRPWSAASWPTTSISWSGATRPARPGSATPSSTARRVSSSRSSLTKRLERGKVNFYARFTDDHGAWYLPFAINVPGGSTRGEYTRLGGSLAPADPARVNADGRTRDFDLAHGRGWKGYVAGGSFEHEFGERLDGPGPLQRHQGRRRHLRHWSPTAGR
ncbi:secretin and TonB N-terminal domain-containing protein [Caulobacter segnis]